MGKPESIIKICAGVRLNSKYEHSIYFPNGAAQLEYFSGKVVKTLSEYSYLRRFWNLKVEATMSQVHAQCWNYVFFKNTDAEGYAFYFINKINYVNDGMVELELEQDVIQTNLFRGIVSPVTGDTVLAPCFIERQHVEDDTVGSNTVDEGLETGDYINNNRYDVDFMKKLSVMALCTVDVTSSLTSDATAKYSANCYATVRNKVFNGMGVFASELNDYTHIAETLAILDASHPDSMVAMWMYPSEFIATDPEQASRKGFKKVIDSNPAKSFEMSRPTTLNGYTPKNNKLRCYPYSFIYVTNNNGSSAVYRWEMFDETKALRPSFHIRGSYTPDGGIKLTPQNYKGIEDNADESLVLSGFPSCAWSSDEYKIWLAQNRNQLQQQSENITLNTTLGLGTSIASIIGGIATQNPLMIGGGVAGAVGTISSAYQQASSIMAQQKDRAIQPPQAKGGFSSNINIVNGCHTFSFYDRCIHPEYAEQIDGFFTMYGYKINRVQTPNIHARKKFTYVKTAGCHVYGNMTNADIEKVESVFNNGITFWVSGDDVGNYNLTNTPL